MYLPAIDQHPDAELVAVCGRRPDPARAMAERWSIPHWFVSPAEMLELDLDAVIVSTANDSHHELSLAAVEAGLHVLCEKPLALNAAQAGEMARAAEGAGVSTLVPFTYRWMPMMQWLRRLVADGYVGTPHQISIRYFSGYALEGEYAWRFDPAVAGPSGVIGDLGSHIVHLARWLLDDVETSVSALASTVVERDARPDGSTYDALDDTAVLTVRYRSGALGVLQASAAAWEGYAEIGQLQQIDIHGSQGTLHGSSDWTSQQEVRGSRVGDEPMAVLPIPEDIWGDVRRESVADTYRDTFRTTPAMTRGWIEAIAAGRRYDGPDFAEGLAVQRVLDAAVASLADGNRAVSLAD
jgi:predicted dehydrogenase